MGSATEIEPAGVRLEGVRVRFGNRVVLDGLTFEARPGEITTLVAPNGGGKTTTFRVVAGLLAPDTGTVRVGGRSQSQGPGRVPVSLASAERIPWWGRAPRRVLLAHAMLYGLGRREAAEAVDRLVRDLGMAGYADRVWQQLSTGEAAKLTFARALLSPARVVIFDEPTAGLDAVAAKAMRAKVEAMRAEGRCVLMATHRIEEVAGISDRVIVIKGGLASDDVDAAALRDRIGLGGAFVEWQGRAEAGWA